MQASTATLVTVMLLLMRTIGSDEALGSPTSAELLDANSNDDIPYLLFRPAPSNDSVDEQERTVVDNEREWRMRTPVGAFDNNGELHSSRPSRRFYFSAQVLPSGALIG